MGNDQQGQPVSEHEPQLSAPDIAALDALIESGLEMTAANTSGAEPDRITRAAALLKLLEPGPITDRALADVAFARIIQARRQNPESELSPDDQEALEAWVMHGYDAEAVPASLRERARRHQALLAAATDIGPIPPSEAGVERTLTHLQRWIDRESQRMTFGRPRRANGPRVRLADLISVAAVVLIGCSVLFPILGAVRDDRIGGGVGKAVVPVGRGAEQRPRLRHEAAVVRERRGREIKCRGAVARDVQPHGRLAAELEGLEVPSREQRSIDERREGGGPEAHLPRARVPRQRFSHGATQRRFACRP